MGIHDDAPTIDHSIAIRRMMDHRLGRIRISNSLGFFGS